MDIGAVGGYNAYQYAQPVVRPAGAGGQDAAITGAAAQAAAGTAGAGASAATGQAGVGGAQAAGAGAEVEKTKGPCQTCANRTYQDGSDDPSVSFQSPTRVDPQIAASVVMSHEMEHVSNEQSKADMENREVISQSVKLHTSICPECGRTYVAGGTTTTVTGERVKSSEDEQENPWERFGVGLSAPDGDGSRVDDAV